MLSNLFSQGQATAYQNRQTNIEFVTTNQSYFCPSVAVTERSKQFRCSENMD